MNKPKYSTERLRNLRSKETRESFIGTLTTIEKYGWQAMLVSSKEQSRSFAYTIGLFDVFGFPELITVGLSTDVAHAALGYAVEAMQKGAALSEGSHPDIVGSVSVVFRPVSREWYEKTMYRAKWYYEGTEVPALQLIYPDLEGRFQWEEGFNDYFQQPLSQPDVNPGPTEHRFSSKEEDEALAKWKFPSGRHTSAFLSQTVFDKTEPITYVSHDDNGDWQFLGDKMSDGGGPVISCLHHPIDEDATLEELHDLPLNWYATREKPGAPWQRFEHPPEEPEEDTAADNPPDAPLLN
jgi:hypothetical protein